MIYITDRTAIKGKMSKNIDKLVDMMNQIMNGEDDATVLDHDTDQETPGNAEVLPGGYIEGGAAGGEFACAVIQNVGEAYKGKGKMIQQDNIDDEDTSYTLPVIKPARYNKKFDMYENDGAGPAPALEHFPAQLIADIVPLQGVKTKAKKPSVRKSKINKDDKAVDQAVVAEPKAKKPPKLKPICKKILDNGEQCKTRSQSRGLCGQHGGSKFCTFVDDKNGECGKIQFSNLGLCKGHSPKCIIDGCIKPTVGRSDKCGDHDKSYRCVFVDVDGNNCESIGRKKHLCIIHGGANPCITEGCDGHSRDKTSGMCKGCGGDKRCIYENCETAAYDKKGLCIAHGGGPRCTFADCGSGARSGFNTCIKHGAGVRCVALECKNSAQYGYDKCAEHGGGKKCDTNDGKCENIAKGSTGKCTLHGGGVRCSEPDCTKSSTSGTGKCIRHGGGVKCTEDGCTKFVQSRGKCIAHGGGQRCPNCIDWIDSRVGIPKYEGFCATCFKHKFPGDPKSVKKYQHTKELMVRQAINTHFDGFVHDTPMYTGNCDCTARRRVDHRKLICGTVLAIETDEFGHVGYDPHDEIIRYDDLVMHHTGKWIFIRFNPDSNIDKVNVDMEDKLKKLIETIADCIEQIENDMNTDFLTIIKLYC